MDMKISVVIPVRNDGEKLSACLDTLVAQSAACEVIVVDGGDDYTFQLCLDYARILDVKWFKEKGEFKCPGNARNIGLQKMTGDIVIFADADSLFEPDFCRKVLEEFDETGCDIAKFRIGELDVLPDMSWVERAYYYRDYARWNNAWCFVYKKSVLPENPFPVGVGYGEDRFFSSMLKGIWDSNRFVKCTTYTVLKFYQRGPTSLNEVVKRYMWYGRTSRAYLDRKFDWHVFGLFVASLYFWLVFPLIIPLARGLAFSSRSLDRYPQGIVIIPFLECLALPCFAAGILQDTFSRRNNDRGV